jgi:hypothetical protein
MHRGDLFAAPWNITPDARLSADGYRMGRLKTGFKLLAFWLLRLTYSFKRLRFKKAIFNAETVKNILLVETALLGDTVAITPLSRALKTKLPSAHITVSVQVKYASLLQANPDIDQLVALQKM